jgi:hypothetical protein
LQVQRAARGIDIATTNSWLHLTRLAVALRRLMCRLR